MNDYRERIIKILIEQGLFDDNKEEFNDQIFTDIITNIDSLSMVNFIISLENEFGIELPDELLIPENIASIDTLTNNIKILLSK